MSNQSKLSAIIPQILHWMQDFSVAIMSLPTARAFDILSLLVKRVKQYFNAFGHKRKLHAVNSIEVRDIVLSDIGYLQIWLIS
jgi:hypothetical protein